MKNISIRKITVNDINQLKKIGEQTFFETYSSGNSKKNMKEYLGNEFSIEKLKTELTNLNSEFYFAELKNDPIGYLKINFNQAQTEIKDGNSLEIERIYVLNKFQGKKNGQILYEKVLEVSKQKNVAYVWLGVWEENPKAIRFYTKNGFVAFDKHTFTVGEDKQTDIMMKLKVNQ